MNSYKCNVCGYLYIPDRGDIRGNIDPGTSFKDLPNDWVCPVCSANKSHFVEYVEQSNKKN